MYVSVIRSSTEFHDWVKVILNIHGSNSQCQKETMIVGSRGTCECTEVLKWGAGQPLCPASRVTLNHSLHMA